MIAGIWRAPVRQHVPKAAFGDVFLHHSFRDIGKPASRERPVQQLGRAPKIEQRLRQLIRRIELTDAGGWYDGEIRETCPAFTTTRYLALGAAGSAIREERRTQSFASRQKISTATRLPSLAQKMTCRVER